MGGKPRECFSHVVPLPQRTTINVATVSELRILKADSIHTLCSSLVNAQDLSCLAARCTRHAVASLSESALRHHLFHDLLDCYPVIDAPQIGNCGPIQFAFLS
jgi:hypothetical protein